MSQSVSQVRCNAVVSPTPYSMPSVSYLTCFVVVAEYPISQNYPFLELRTLEEPLLVYIKV